MQVIGVDITDADMAWDGFLNPVGGIADPTVSGGFEVAGAVHEAPGGGGAYLHRFRPPGQDAGWSIPVDVD